MEGLEDHLKPPPAFQFYPDDFMAGTINMSDEEKGLYITLLSAQWNLGSLPDDDAELALYSRGNSDIKKTLARVRKKFVVCPDGKLRNRRLEQVRQKAEDFREHCRQAGKSGGGNPAFKKGKPNQYYQKDKPDINQPLSQKDKPPLSSPPKSKITGETNQTENPHKPTFMLGLDVAVVENDAKDKGRHKPKINSPVSSLQSPLTESVRVPRARDGRRPRNLEECLAAADMLGVTPEDAKRWFLDCEVCEWKRGDGTPFDNWQRQLTIHRNKLMEAGEIRKQRSNGPPKTDDTCW